MDVLVVGSMGYDAISTPEGQGSDLLGGSGTYAGIAAAKMGAKVAVVGVVGSDFRSEDRHLLEQEGLDLRGLEVAEGATFRWSGMYQDTMAEAVTLSTDLNVLESFDPKIPAEIAAPSVLLCANLHPSVQAAAMDQVNASRAVMLDSMNLWIDIAREGLEQVLKRADIVVLNDGEVRALGASSTLAVAALRVREMLHDDAVLVVKRGEHGAYVLHPSGPMSLPAVPSTDLVDPTGCGDSFAGTLAAVLARGEGPIGRSELRDALEQATAVASFTLASIGTTSLLGMTEVDRNARLEALRRLQH